MAGYLHFFVFMAVSFIVYVLIIHLALHSRVQKPTRTRIFTVGIVVVIGMLWGKLGANAGWPWQLYYPVPMILMVLVPPIAFRMRWRETLLYLVLSFLSAPIIHLFFSFFFGWKEFMPFIKVPSLWEL